MYYIIAIESLGTLNITDVKDRIERLLEHKNWVKPMTNIYFVQEESQDERDAIDSMLKNYSGEHQKQLKYFISPISSIRGGFSGILSKETIPHIKVITGPKNNENGEL